MFTPIQNDHKTQGVIIARLWLQSYHSKLSTSGEYLFLSLKEILIINNYDPTISNNIISNADIHHGNQLLNMVEPSFKSKNVTWILSKISFSATCNFIPKVFH